LGDTWEENPPAPELSPQEIWNLIRPPKTGEPPRLIHLGRCRRWALKKENWNRLIPEAKGLFLREAQEHNDNEFLEAIEEFERRKRRAGKALGKEVKGWPITKR